MTPGDERARVVGAALAALPLDVPAAAMRDGERWIVGVDPEIVRDIDGSDAFNALDGIRDGWWAGWLSYELGHAVERVQQSRTAVVPDMRLARFDARLVVEPGRVYVEGDGETRGALLDAARETMTAADVWTTSTTAPVGEWGSSLSRGQWCEHVETILEHIRAGDCYQVNLTRQLRLGTSVDPVALFGSLAQHNPAPHAAMLRFTDVSVVSASPERFVRRDGDAVETRPIKGTAPDGPGGAEWLAHSAKDRAENVMIVDLSRNDLGRACAFGTITVPELCAVEQHPGLLHLVSSVRGMLRPGLGLGALMRATFPPASITGAPKPRVMQIINDLEPVPRGVYCGAVGWIDGDHHVADFNVAIRTFTITQDATMLGVGAGIVTDSDPLREWEETELKSQRLLCAVGARDVIGVRR